MTISPKKSSYISRVIGRIPSMVLERSRQKRAAQARNYVPAAFPKQVTAGIAMDENAVALTNWAAGQISARFDEGLLFPGFAYLSELAQRPEYRRMAETVSRHMTRRWIRLTSTGGDPIAKQDRIKAIEAALKRLDAKNLFRQAAEKDAYFGRAHIYLDFGDSDDRAELKQNVGTGCDDVSKGKIGKGDLKGLKLIEPVWCYPLSLNTSNPLKADWYRPGAWSVMGTEVHRSRLLTFISREVPDVLKPVYGFGGLPLTQMAKPYVDNWLRTRQSVSDLIASFSTFVFGTDMAAQLNSGDGGEAMYDRFELFNNLRDNHGVMAIDKNREQLENISVPLGTLDMLQAQSQEQMAAVSAIPITLLLGIAPHGLNASSEGEIRIFYEWIGGSQELLFRRDLTKLIQIIQLSECGDVDPEIDFVFEPLWVMDDKELAEIDSVKAQTDSARITDGVISPEEARQRLSEDEEGPYLGLSMAEEDLPLPPATEQPPGGPDDGLEPGLQQPDDLEEPRAAA